MIPVDVLQILSPIFNSDVTDYDPINASANFHVISSNDPLARELGIKQVGPIEVIVLLENCDNSVGGISLHAAQTGNIVVLNNRSEVANLRANCRFMGRGSAIIIDECLGRYTALHDVFLRGNHQFLFWGKGASAVGCSVEIEGDRRGVVIGDDALVSSGVWIRNHDMHSVVDLPSGRLIGGGAVTTIVERHVWIGMQVLLLKCPRIGKGSIIGAASLVNKVVPPFSSAAGVPARHLRSQVSWGRDVHGITEAEMTSLGKLDM